MGDVGGGGGGGGRPLISIPFSVSLSLHVHAPTVLFHSFLFYSFQLDMIRQCDEFDDIR